jgi:hemoglobin-like flavoprotein
MEPRILKTFEESLARCNAHPSFLDRFYEIFLASSPKVKEKFARTDFVHQKRALRASLHMMLLAAENEDKGPVRYLRDLAVSHSRQHLDIGAELYDFWLDSLLATVKECDKEYDPAVEEAWEQVMMVGISYLLGHYHQPPGRAYR